MSTGTDRKLQWKYQEHRDGEVARFTGAGFKAYAQDCDGDFSFWEVSYHGTKIAHEATVYGHDPYHFDLAILRSENAIREYAASRLVALAAQAQKEEE